ncbi:molybdate ABC transporter permease subunit [Halalkalibacter akibai]|uniref:Molybdenum transport system permease n=1 Tax=Halalkalibacter akibai (strain ATCC 43226 / DSM 21942 / CIP 109018 / JCM 9157 / 1139) TaxID=1236973 RepID=W4QUP3_HALA3|nr:molybdate ABC transporter permease subunit [Halalkalibacter akibai]GAE35049.1 molybdenum transport system permease protein ModB [Halalkalibacter akibai JCM 9157]
MDTIINPLLLSLKIASIATLIAFVVGILCAWWFAFNKNKLTDLLSILITIPLIIPPTVLGYYLLLLLGRNSFIGQWIENLTGQPIVFTWKAAVIAATIAAIPLLIRPIQAAFESISKETIGAAQLDGADKFQLLIYIIIPLAYKGVLAGLVLGFARAMGEFGATLMVAGNIPGKTQTLSIAIYDAVQADRMMDAHIMVLILSVATLLFLYLIHRWFK